MATPRKRFTALTSRTQAIRLTEAMLDTAQRYLQGKIVRSTMQTHLRPLFMAACDHDPKATCNRLFKELDRGSNSAFVVKQIITRMKFKQTIEAK